MRNRGNGGTQNSLASGPVHSPQHKQTLGSNILKNLKNKHLGVYEKKWPFCGTLRRQCAPQDALFLSRRLICTKFKGKSRDFHMDFRTVAQYGK